MSNDVFANGREVSCKAASGKSPAAFPDVCFTPPQTPASPPGVPIPYPNTGMATDTTSGSKTVKISNKEVMLKDSSYFKKSMGDEAGCAPKKNVITSKNMGKVYFTSWSMDVKIEGENAVRHMDMTTHNHASTPGGTPPWMHVDEMSQEAQEACEQEIENAGKACKGKRRDNCGDKCRKAQKCLLVPKNQASSRCCSDAPSGGGPPETTGHHMIEVHWVNGNPNFPMAQGTRDSHPGYGNAPTVCANRYRSNGTPHRELHDVQGTFEEAYMPAGGGHPAGDRFGQTFTYGEGKRGAIHAHQTVFDDSVVLPDGTTTACSKRCLEQQLDDFYGEDNSRPLHVGNRQGLGDAREPTRDGWGSILED